MKRLENEAFRTAFLLLWPLVFYELCIEMAAWLCAFCGIEDSLFVTGAGALLALPFLAAAYRRKKRCCGNSRFQSVHKEPECKKSEMAGSRQEALWRLLPGQEHVFS